MPDQYNHTFRKQEPSHETIIFGILSLVGSWGDAGPQLLVEGRVLLPFGAPVPGAQVLLFDLSDLRTAPLAATTDRSGHFSRPLGFLEGAPKA